MELHENSVETLFLTVRTRNALLHCYLSQTAECLCQSQLCEQIARQSGCSVPHACPAVTHANTEKTSVPPKPLRHRPRPSSAVLDLWRPTLDRELFSHYSEVGSLCRRRRRPPHSLGQGWKTTQSRPCSVIETSVTRETQSVELHNTVRCQMTNRHLFTNSLLNLVVLSMIMSSLINIQSMCNMCYINPDGNNESLINRPHRLTDKFSSHNESSTR